MENQVNVGNQNTQQIDQNPVNQPIQIPEKPKVKYIILGLVIGLVILVLLFFLAYLFWGKSIFSNRRGVGIDLPNQSQSNEVLNFETITLGSADLNDSKTELIFSDANKLYKTKLDDSKPILINSFTYNIKSVSALKDDRILVVTGYTKYTKPDGSDPNIKSLGWTPVSSAEKSYLVNESTKTKEEIDENTHGELLGRKDFYTASERIYTKIGENPEIFSDTLDGNQPKKIGVILQNSIKGKKINVSGRDFIPSFDGSYLLNRDYGKGIEPMFVVSRDGSKTYDLNIDSGWNSMVWINNNMLFADNEGQALTITFNVDGTFTKKPLNVDLSSYENFSQSELSPNKKYLFLAHRIFGVSVYDLDKNAIVPIEKGNSNTHSWFSFIAWNEKGDKSIYRSDINAGSADSETEIKIYDTSTNKSYTVFKFSNTTTDENMTADKPKANIFHFDIR